jgi:hypothetical protein
MMVVLVMIINYSSNNQVVHRVEYVPYVLYLLLYSLLPLALLYTISLNHPVTHRMVSIPLLESPSLFRVNVCFVTIASKSLVKPPAVAHGSNIGWFSPASYIGDSVNITNYIPFIGDTTVIE